MAKEQQIQALKKAVQELNDLDDEAVKFLQAIDRTAIGFLSAADVNMQVGTVLIDTASEIMAARNALIHARAKLTYRKETVSSRLRAIETTTP
jgi:chaperonin cofactor prefoldin